MQGSSLLFARVAALLLLTLAAMTAGCTTPEQYFKNGFKVGPNYSKPEAPVESQWIDYRKDPRVKSCEADTSAWWGILNDQKLKALISQWIDCQKAPWLKPCETDTSAWWGVLNDQKLNALILTASRQNVTLRTAGARIIQAQAVRGIAVGTFFPQVQQLSGSFNRVSQTFPPLDRRTSTDTWNTGIGLSWELDFWGQYRRGIESADAALEASVQGYDNVLVLLVSDVAATYVQFRALQEQLRLVQMNVKAQRESLAIAKAQFKAGRANESDVLQCQNNVDQTEAFIPIYEQQLRQTGNALCILLGSPPRDLTPELGVGPIPVAPPEVAVGIPTALVHRRPDVRQAERLAAAQCAQIGIAEAQMYPHLGISGAIEWQSNHLGGLFDPTNRVTAVGGSFVWNFLNYGRLLNATAEQRAIFDQAVFTYQDTVLRAQREVEDAIAGFLQSQEQQKKLQAAVGDITKLESLLLTQAKFGATDYNRVFVVQAQKTMQESDLASSNANITLNLIRIYRALGSGWQIRLQPPDTH